METSLANFFEDVNPKVSDNVQRQKEIKTSASNEIVIYIVGLNQCNITNKLWINEVRMNSAHDSSSLISTRAFLAAL